MGKKKLILQPGKMGDLVITTPIAQFYARQGYEVYWPVFDNYKHYFDAFPDIHSFTLNVEMDPYAYYKNTRIDRGNPQVFLNAGGQFFKNLQEWLQRVVNRGDFEILDFCFTFPGHANNINNQMTQIFFLSVKTKIHLTNLTSSTLS